MIFGVAKALWTSNNSSSTKAHNCTRKATAQSTELAEYVGKTVLESKNGSLGKKLEPDKVRFFRLGNFPKSWFWEDFRLGGRRLLSSAPAAGLSELCENHEKKQ